MYVRSWADLSTALETLPPLFGLFSITPMHPPQAWTPAQIERAAETQLKRWRDRQAYNAERREALIQVAGAAARLLMTEYGARQVWLFGSVAWGEVHERSDLDLLVAGLPAHEEDRAVRAVETLSPFPVDLVRAEEAPQALVERIHLEGRLLDEP